MKHIIQVLIVVSTLFFLEAILSETTLWGIYGAHSKHDCPVNNRETDLKLLMKNYGITSMLAL